MTTNHIDQLAQWYADAEQVTKTNLPRKGDTLIYPRRTSGYIIEADGGGWIPDLVHSTGETVRILTRAPKPKPAWHDAVAVIAHTKGWGRRRVFTRHEGASTNGNRIWSCGNLNYGSDDLIDPVPLIEAKVTDAQVRKVLDQYYEYETPQDWPEGTVALMRYAITAALGLETE